MYSSAGKRSPGRLSRQGPAVLRWCVYEAGNTHAAPAPPTTPATRPRRTGSTVSAPPCPRPAKSSGRPATSCPGSATTARHVVTAGQRARPVTRRHPGTASGAALTRWGTTAASSRHAAVSRPACSAGPRGRPLETERPHPRRRGMRPPDHHHVARHIISPRAQVSLAAPSPQTPPSRQAHPPPATGRPAPPQPPDYPSVPRSPPPRPPHDLAPGRPRQRRLRRRSAGAARP